MPTTHARRGRHFLVPVALGALLAACGGSSSDAEDLGRSIGAGFANGVVCAMANCKPSSEAATQDVRLSYTATQTGSVLTVKAQLHQDGKWAVLQLADGDALSADLQGRTLELKPSSPGAASYEANFEGMAEQVRVTVNFHRAGRTYGSSVQIPPRFTMLSPGGAVRMSNRGADLDVLLQVPSQARPLLTSSARCTHQDGSFSAFTQTPPFELIETQGELQRYRLRSADLARFVAQTLHGGSGSGNNPIKSCDFSLAWAIAQTGSVPTGISSGGSRSGEYAVPLDVRYELLP
jgi:hypothetical protein